jgi:hypothetical protein
MVAPRIETMRHGSGIAPIFGELQATSVTSLRAIAEALDVRGIPTAGGRRYRCATQVRRCWRGCRPDPFRVVGMTAASIVHKHIVGD